VCASGQRHPARYAGWSRAVLRRITDLYAARQRSIGRLGLLDYRDWGRPADSTLASANSDDDGPRETVRKLARKRDPAGVFSGPATCYLQTCRNGRSEY